MTIVLSCVIFLVFLFMAYFWMGRNWLQRSGNDFRKQPPAEFGCEARTPDGYSFHLGHTWIHSQDGEHARIGIDDFAAQILGEITHIDVIGTNRWVRQGQRIMTIQSAGISVDFLSPAEGVIIEVNEQARREPSLASRSPLGVGWVALIKVADLKTQQQNLLCGAVADQWMRNCAERVQEMLAESGEVLENKGRSSGMLARVSPELRQKLLREFFHSESNRASA